MTYDEGNDYRASLKKRTEVREVALLENKVAIITDAARRNGEGATRVMAKSRSGNKTF